MNRINENAVLIAALALVAAMGLYALVLLVMTG
jgi:hypothetical protein